jgi:hypothetical protein
MSHRVQVGGNLSGGRAQRYARGTADGQSGVDSDRSNEHEHLNQLLVALIAALAVPSL